MIWSRGTVMSMCLESNTFHEGIPVKSFYRQRMPLKKRRKGAGKKSAKPQEKEDVTPKHDTPEKSRKSGEKDSAEIDKTSTSAMAGSLPGSGHKRSSSNTPSSQHS